MHGERRRQENPPTNYVARCWKVRGWSLEAFIGFGPLRGMQRVQQFVPEDAAGAALAPSHGGRAALCGLGVDYDTLS